MAEDGSRHVLQGPPPCGHARYPFLPPPPPRTNEIADALSFALRYQGRKREHHADDMMARITAERLEQHLEASGFVLMKGPPRGAPITALTPPSRGA